MTERNSLYKYNIWPKHIGNGKQLKYAKPHGMDQSFK